MCSWWPEVNVLYNSSRIRSLEAWILPLKWSEAQRGALGMAGAWDTHSGVRIWGNREKMCYKTAQSSRGLESQTFGNVQSNLGAPRQEGKGRKPEIHPKLPLLWWQRVWLRFIGDQKGTVRWWAWRRRNRFISFQLQSSTTSLFVLFLSWNQSYIVMVVKGTLTPDSWVPVLYKVSVFSDKYSRD